IVVDLVGGQVLNARCVGRGLRLGGAENLGRSHLGRVLACDDGQHAWETAGARVVDREDTAARDVGRDERRVREVVQPVFRGERGLAGGLHDTVNATDRSANGAVLHLYRAHYRAHRASPSCSRPFNTLTMVRWARSILNALCSSPRAGSSSCAAAARNVSAVAGAPARARSAAIARHGLCATPPSASLTPRTLPASTSSAAATDTSANA